MFMALKTHFFFFTIHPLKTSWNILENFTTHRAKSIWMSAWSLYTSRNVSFELFSQTARALPTNLRIFSASGMVRLTKLQ